MRMILSIIAAVLLPTIAKAECWVAGNITGRSASAFENFSFDDDGFPAMLICFTDEGGTVTGNDLQLVRLGPSTLIGWDANENGLEVVNTYQLDRERGKLLITQSRIGTASITSLLPDYAAVFVGDAKPAPR
ncbi:MAG: hypothetical protein IIX61_07770 [Loktanella sp.]|nr:hypothetical protein [Loktanella sp.]